MLLDSDSESEEVEDNDDLLTTLALAYHTISDPRYLNRGDFCRDTDEQLRGTMQPIEQERIVGTR